MTRSIQDAPEPLLRARVAVSLTFLVLGTQLGLWFAHIPAVARRLDLGPAALSVALLAIGIIGLVTQWIAGVAITRIGSRRTTHVLLPAFVVAKTLLIAAPSAPLFFLFAALTGVVSMPANVGINTLAAEYERRLDRPAMSSFHGFFSVGGLVGSSLGGWLVATGHGDGGGAMVAAIALFLVSLWATTQADIGSSGAPRPDQTSFLTVPPRALFGLGLLVLGTTVIEGSIGNWSALFLDTVKQADPTLAASGYTLFSVVMAAMRFAGGPIVGRLGHRTLIAGGGSLMAAGLLIVILAPTPLTSALGFLVVALGASNLVPVLITDAARIPGVAPSIGIAALTTFLTLGLLAGPPALGFVAEAWGLSAAFVVLALLAGLVAVGGCLRRRAPTATGVSSP